MLSAQLNTKHSAPLAVPGEAPRLLHVCRYRVLFNTLLAGDEGYAVNNLLFRLPGSVSGVGAMPHL